MVIRTDPEEFKRFHELLTRGRPDYRPFYFPLSIHDKDPLTGRRWSDQKNRLTLEEAVKFMLHGYNIGIAGTDKDDLVIVDIDDISITPLDMMKPTLMSFSRKRIGRHHFYFSKDPECKKNLPTDEAGEIRSIWQYVVAPGSYVSCSKEEIERMPPEQRGRAGHYTVENTITPTDISEIDLPQVFKDQLEKEKKIPEKPARQRKRHIDKKDNSALFSLSMGEVVGAVPQRDRFPSLFHTSETGKNTSMSGGLLHCWRHNVTHTPLSALAVMADITTCQGGGIGHKGSGVGPSTIDYTDPHTLFTIWAFAKREGIIPREDPIPKKALVWYALENGICKKNEVFDGWELPMREHNQTIALIEAEEKISAGREKKKAIKKDKDNNNRYEILNYKQFQKLIKRSPDDIRVERCGERGEYPIYEIVGDEFIKLATDLEIIQLSQGWDNDKAIVITDPEQLEEYITRVSTVKDGVDSRYYITIRENKIDFAINELMDATIWRDRLIQCKIVISFDLKKHANKTAWSMMIANILNHAVVEWEETMSGDDLTADIIMGRLRHLPIVIEEDDFIDSNNILDANDMYLVSTTTLVDVLGQIVTKKSLPEIRRLLSKYIVKNSEQKRIGGNRFSVWFFKKWEES